MDIEPIRVVLVDDQQLVREGISTLLSLSEKIRVVAELQDGATALQRIPELQADVVLMDVRMPGMSGIEVMQQLQARQQLPPVIILTTFDHGDVLLEALKAGARGYLLKDVSLPTLVSAIETVHNGGSLMQPALTERIAREWQSPVKAFGSIAEPEALSERETEVLRLMSGGCSNKEIANALKLSEGTVKNHVSTILNKMGVRDRTRAVLKAIEMRWI